MQWGWSGVGLIGSIAVIVLVGAKWKLPLGLVGAGGTAAGIAAAALSVVASPLFGAKWLLALSFQTLLAVGLAVGLAMLRFWRDPERVSPDDPGAIISPADGKVLYVVFAGEGETPLVTKHGRSYALSELTRVRVPAGPAYVIGVEMTILDVHVNRCPMAGRVSSLVRVGGKFLSLRKEEAPFVNERVTTVIENESVSVAVVQVASRLVRRIRSYLVTGDTVQAGQRLGMIAFGSLVAIVLPVTASLQIQVEPGDAVRAGVSVMARYGADGEGS